MPYQPPPGGRLRAALAYAQLKDPDAAELLDVSVRQLARLKKGTAPLTDPQKVALIERTGVPAWFLEHGWEPPVAIREREALDRIAALERQVTAIMQRDDERRVASALGAVEREAKAAHREAPRPTRETARRSGSADASGRR